MRYQAALRPVLGISAICGNPVLTFVLKARLLGPSYLSRSTFVTLVLAVGVITQVGRTVIPAAVREVADHLAFGSWTQEGFCNQTVDHSRLHSSKAIPEVDL